MNIILFGFQNCGKTTVGRLLADKLRMTFIDVDSIIEEYFLRHNNKVLTVREVYREFGEDYFRLLERKAVRSISNVDNSVIATGGGTVLNPENVDLLKNIGVLLYLEAGKSEIRERMFAKPLPQFLDLDNPLLSFDQMYSKREKIYKNIADLSVVITGKSSEEIIDEIKKEVQNGE